MTTLEIVEARLREFAGAYTKHRLTRQDVAAISKQLMPIIKKHSTEAFLAGSYRRGVEDIGDMDFIVTDCDLHALLDDLGNRFEVKTVARSGDKIATIVMHLSAKSEAQVEFVNVPDKSVGAAMLHSTGSGQFNVGLRTYARQKYGYILNQYGLFSGNRRIAGSTENEIFRKLGLKFIPPVARNNGFWGTKDAYKIRK